MTSRKEKIRELNEQRMYSIELEIKLLQCINCYMDGYKLNNSLNETQQYIKLLSEEIDLLVKKEKIERACFESKKSDEIRQSIINALVKKPIGRVVDTGKRKVIIVPFGCIDSAEKHYKDEDVTLIYIMGYKDLKNK